MKLTNRFYPDQLTKVDLFAVGVFEGESKPFKDFSKLDPAAFNVAALAIKEKRFSGKPGEQFHGFNPSFEQGKELLLVGLGKKDSWSRCGLRKAAAGILNYANASSVKTVRVLAEGLAVGKVKLDEVVSEIPTTLNLANYKFDRYQTKESLLPKRSVGAVELLFAKSAGRKEIEKKLGNARVISEAVNFTRDLVNEPGNVLSPREFAERARKVAKENGIRFDILGPAEIKKSKMNGILAVSQGSHEPPQLVVMEYGSSYKKSGTVCLVGKGVTFDSGGISIKPSKDMEKMKYDMSGAAAVVGTLKAISQLKLKIHVVGIMPCVENMPGGGAQRPGDIIRMSNGKSVEVINTDAEGRLILADALHYAGNFKPSAMIDLATLTGACVVALGDKAIGLMGTDSKLVEKIREAGENVGERCWELPLWEDYFDYIKGHHSDILNAGQGMAGTITGAMFLKEFVPVKSWAHLDIAGTAYIDSNRPANPKGATGVGVRLLVELLQNW